MMHSLCFRFLPLFPSKIFYLLENFPNFTFSGENIPIFIRQNFHDKLLPSCFYKFPSDFLNFTCFLHTLHVFSFRSTVTMMHLCITQCTYLTPLVSIIRVHLSFTYLR